MGAFDMQTETVSIEFITPEIAQALLASSPGNRKNKPGHIESIAADIAVGRFPLTPNGIGIDINGKLRDGHNRLKAILKAGVGARLIVLRGMSPEAVQVTDTGYARSFSDVKKFAGWEESANHAAVAKIVALGRESTNKYKRPPHHKLHEIYLENKAYIDAAIGFTGNNMPAPVTAVMARALKSGADVERVRKFAEILRTGVCNAKTDTAAIRLRDFLSKMKGGGAVVLDERYQKTQAALNAFLNYRPMAALRGTVEEIY